MLKIALVVPDKDFYKDFTELFEEHNREEKYYNQWSDYIFEEIVITPETIYKFKTDADVIITRGGIVNILRNKDITVPVVAINLTTLDLLYYLYESKEKYGNKKVAIMRVDYMFFDVEYMMKLLGIPLWILTTDNISDYANLVDTAVDDGCEVIVGDYYTCKYAESKGIKNIFVQTGKESLWQALTEAKVAAQVNYISQYRKGKLESILDSTGQGIIFLNKARQIENINNMAAEILYIKDMPSVIGQNINDVIFGHDDLMNAILSGHEYLNKFIDFNNIALNFSKVFVVLKGEPVGVLITIQKVNSLEKIEGEIRKQVYGKGHVAQAHFDDIVGESAIINNMIKKARKFSLTKSNVFLTGESGTGKEILAQSIHNNSQRKDGPFVAINCAALPESLLESELFGYEKGAFTGADSKGKPGLFELAHRGTIFLDEIGEMPISLQAKILRVIQEREVSRLGGVNVIPLDIRIVSATNKNINQLIEENKFREDLYYRLNVLNIYLPSLNDRREDIPLLMKYFFDHNFEGIAVEHEAYLMMRDYNWRGNVRQLFNICEQLGVLCDDNLVTGKDVQRVLYEGKDFLNIKTNKENIYSKDLNEKTGLVNSSEELNEKERIIAVLESVKYSRKDAARILNIDKSTLWRKMKKYGI